MLVAYGTVIIIRVRRQSTEHQVSSVTCYYHKYKMQHAEQCMCMNERCMCATYLSV